jgi:hypothetical protein
MLTRSLDTSIVLSGPVPRSPQDDSGFGDDLMRQLRPTNFVITDKHISVYHPLQFGGVPAGRERYDDPFSREEALRLPNSGTQVTVS